MRESLITLRVGRRECRSRRRATGDVEKLLGLVGEGGATIMEEGMAGPLGDAGELCDEETPVEVEALPPVIVELDAFTANIVLLVFVSAIE